MKSKDLPLAKSEVGYYYDRQAVATWFQNLCAISLFKGGQSQPMVGSKRSFNQPAKRAHWVISFDNYRSIETLSGKHELANSR